jgi:anti-anti-sigma factor
MQVSTRQSYDVLIVDMEGRLDSKSSGYSYDEMVAIAQGKTKRVVVNLEKLDFITSAGLRVLLMASKLLKSGGGDLKLCKPNDMVKDVLETAGFDSLLHLYDTETEAVKSFG